ncbi:type I restriction endonuclease subunit R [Alteromonas mediterranea]|uniref:Type I restriction enzyme endonuclease subunit n=1 Tax=Alteromonas mediterranea TaxID=314275 RepID=A0AAC9F6R0_9ALTE|nr:HsdR family type I site-specific deoxyribonuclease [Alteromonas mediterranea]AFV84413.1 HsdR family type I site-specific deoxyribonuclease [Alteromonas mediterranea DE1]AGP96420.1 HsdR family type I site-specific deoxyribonuclease [Alteromonas mediterranea UM7]AMJ77603.1 DEAD/DEAH box helicase [Alteromonas mediterranea]AMJ81748.1 DEAD/DEAH box helicase [Alteromonas mediterranea]HBL21761.1 DEAD/DEAH box helicase [Alteromonas mediterranea]|tara:strand:- start:2658 stop:5708 length:3051 start_codon:yes stop_codon:yes gene_type:complete
MFNEHTVTENGIIDRLKGLSGVKWTYCHGESLPKKAQDIFVDEWLKDALCSLNPDIAKQPDYADEVIHKLRGLMLEARNTGLAKANENFQEWLMAEKSLPFGENGDHITINLIDIDNIKNNHFVVSQQVHYIAATEVYFDIVLYVNGIPLVVGEVKTATRPSVTWQDGAADFMGGKKHYWKNVEPFFVPNLLCFASEGKTFAYGAINARVKDWGPWHNTDQREEILPGMASVLQSVEGLLNPKTLLQLLESFALFSTIKTGKHTPPKRIKILPRYPQFEAAKQIVDRVRNGYPKKGLIWHFQGSGKSLLMLYAAKMLRADNELNNPTVLVVVDRRDLDSQINETFGGADVKNLIKVQSCKKLGEHIEQDSRGILITTIFKFKDVVIDDSNPNGLNNRDNIIVLVDEAHRTQEGGLGEKMRWALPKAHFYGLTGTPISGIDRNTFKLFGAEEDPGRYMNRYSYKQSIRDGATNPVKFEPRLAELRVDRDAINQEFEQLAKDNNLDDEEKAALSKRAGKLAVMLKASKRMAAVSNDIVEHFYSHVKPKKMKGMVVVYDRDACVQMYYLLGEKLGFDAVEVVMNVDQAPIIDDKGKKNKDWAKWESDKDIPVKEDDFKRWQIIDAEEQTQKDLIEGYKDPQNPLQLIIVTAKLLTGFDAPICYCMYLDKPLRDHTLLQAMCRTNRLYETDETRKNIGLIIDYLGVFENLRTALAYNPDEIEGVVEGIEAFKALLPTQLEKCLSFFPGVDRTLEGFEGVMAAQDCLPSNEKRDEFAASFGVLTKLWSAINPDPFLNPYRQDYKWLAQIYESVRPVSQTGALVWAALGPETIKIIHENTDIKRIRDDIDELIMDEHAIFTLTEKEQEQRAKRLEIDLMGRLRGSGEPKFVELGERLEKLRQDYEAGVIKAIDWLKALLDTAKDTVQAERETGEKVVTEEDNVQALTKLFMETRPNSTPQVIQDVVEQIDKIVKAKRFDGWQNSNSGPREIQKALLVTLAQFGLGKDKELFNKAYGYIEEYY